MRESAFRHSTYIEKNLVPDSSRRAMAYEKRQVFSCLPVHNGNDLVVGSWYFVYGSLLFILISIIPLINVNVLFWPKNTFGNVSEAEVIILSLFFIISGFFFMAGSFAFVRALRDPDLKVPPIFEHWKHIGTDEQLGAWLYLCAMCPYPFYVGVYIYNSPNNPELWAAFAASLLCVLALGLFVRACYPAVERKSSITSCSTVEKEPPQFCRCIPESLRWIFGEKSCLARHLQNDWLIGCWIFFVGSCLFTIAFFLRMADGIREDNFGLVFISGLIGADFLVFTIGCAYFCAGSYSETSPLSARLMGDRESVGGATWATSGEIL